MAATNEANPPAVENTARRRLRDLVCAFCGALNSLVEEATDQGKCRCCWGDLNIALEKGMIRHVRV